MLKKLLCLALAGILSIGMSTSVFAANYQKEELVCINGKQIDINTYSEGQIKIIPSTHRISSTGEFTFDVGYSVRSDKFKVNSTETTFTITAGIEGSTGTNITSQYPNHKYQIILYKDNFWNTKVDSSYFYADGSQDTWTVINLDKNQKYYFVIYNTDSLPAGTTVVGNGSISNYVHI